MGKIKVGLAIGLLLNAFLTAVGQEAVSPVLKAMVEQSKEEVEALALYPDDIRDAILEATLYPELLVKMKGIQANTEKSFAQTLSLYSEEDQTKLWDITKYAGLTGKLVNERITDQQQVYAILQDYPEEIHQVAFDLWLYDLPALKKITELDKNASKGLDDVILGYPKKTQESFRLLLNNPEVLHILSSHLDMAILVGDLYGKDPVLVKRKADSMRMEASIRHAREVDQWTKGLEEDPAAFREFENATREFADKEELQSYDPMYPDLVQTEVMVEENPEEVPQSGITNFHNYYYPYWFGYPYWYPESYWYGLSYWYHWGYYFGPERNVVIVSGLPSYYFVSWYFNKPAHHYKYPHFSEYVIRYYRNEPRPSRTGLSAAIDDWRTKDRSNVRTNLLNGDINTARIRDYGRFEERYQKNYGDQPVQEITRQRYLDENRRRFPYLSGEAIPTSRKSIEERGDIRIRSVQPNQSGTLQRAIDLHSRTWNKSPLFTRPGRTAKPAPIAPVRKPRKKNN